MTSGVWASEGKETSRLTCQVASVPGWVVTASRPSWSAARHRPAVGQTTAL